MTNMEFKIIRRLQNGYPLCERPYGQIAEGLGIKEEQIIKAIRGMVKNKIIRRTGCTLSHYRLGFKTNAMVVWNVPSNKVDMVGKIMAGFPFVSHCYERNRLADFQYNLYTMLHAKTKIELNKNIRKISKTIRADDYIVLNSVKELKKTSPNYNSMRT